MQSRLLSALLMFLLKSASKSRSSGDWAKDDYDVFDGDQHIGRIMWTHAAGLPPEKWSSLKYGLWPCGAAPFCGPGSREFLGLFEFGVRTRSASSYRARYAVCRCCSGTSILRADRQRLSSTGTMMR